VLGRFSGRTASAMCGHEQMGALSLEQKVRLLTGADFWALHAEPAVGLRRVVTSDGPAGVRGERWDERDPSANVPSPTALVATWDEARIERLGDLMGAECRRPAGDGEPAPHALRRPALRVLQRGSAADRAHRRGARARPAGWRGGGHGQALRRQRLRDRASRWTRVSTSAHWASSTSPRSRRSCATRGRER